MATIHNLHAIQNEIMDEDIVFFYSGYITEELLMSVGNTIKKKLSIVQTNKKISRTVFALFVEEVQNIIRYSKGVIRKQALPEEEFEEIDSLRHGFISIGRFDESYYVCCGNLVLDEDVERLESHLKKIQELDPQELKAVYKDILKKGPPEGSKGAGIGFVDIARRASGGFDYQFMNVDDKHKYFYLKAYA